MTTRARTQAGERLMQATIDRCMTDLECTSDDIERSYVATAFLMVAMDELTTGVPLDHALDLVNDLRTQLLAKAG